MTIAAINAANAPAAPAAKSGFAALGQGDFLKLMTEQLKLQDPFAPVDNKEMLAQMAQFSSLAGISTINDTLKAISTKLDAVLAVNPPPEGIQQMSFYTSLNGLKNAQVDLGTVAHNIANVETTGFKKSRVDFADIVAGSAYSNPKLIQGIGATVESISQNFSLGPIEQTGSALDLAINGDGFFTTVSALTGQTYYTRNGGFEIDDQGFVHDGSDNRLQVLPTDAAGNVTSTTPTSAQVPITNAAGADLAGLTVDGDGALIATFSDGTNQTVGKVALAAFIAPTGLKQVGSSNWEATGLSGTARYGQPGTGQYGRLLSGALERSNVDIAEELVNLITAQRNFQANAKAIDTATQISQTIINLRT